MGGQVRTPKLSLEGGGQLRTPKLSLADGGGRGAPPLVTLSLLLRFFLWCGFPKISKFFKLLLKVDQFIFSHKVANRINHPHGYLDPSDTNATNDNLEQIALKSNGSETQF